MSNLTLQEILLGMTVVLTLLNILNGHRQAKLHETATNPAIIAIDKKADETQMHVKYIRESLDAQVSNYVSTNRRIDEVVSEQSMIKASVSTLQETVKIMQKTIEMQQNMILKMQGRES